ncbi:hypothetical protein RJ639_041651 [Escallonia herrerae]|uniref:DUF7788 domain-containing protein n=1 Tax=Escallonia herrerae TaxID=1293975 RepID=A0AA88WL89_9ASTE|nr:hypothetical protein RJ639_041651 [Escallonia herrerae]
MDWGMNTNFQKVFDRILEITAEGKLSEDQMIKRVSVFSDMEFDVASQNPWETDYEAIQRKFGEKGHQTYAADYTSATMMIPSDLPSAAASIWVFKKLKANVSKGAK